MKIGILADIHSNILALNAVLVDAQINGVDHFLIAGDLIGDGPCPQEVLRRIQELGAWVVLGNRDADVLQFHKGMFPQWNEYKQMAAMLWTAKQLGGDDLEYLRSLTDSIRVDIEGCERIRLVHGSPFHIYEHLFREQYPERIQNALEGISENILICGHTHEPWHQMIQGKIIINPGAVGVHFNQEQAAEYAIMTIDQGKWSVEHRRVCYDLDALVEEFKATGLYEAGGAWTQAVLQSIFTGENASIAFVRYAYGLAEKEGLKGIRFIPNWIWEEAQRTWDWKRGLFRHKCSKLYNVIK